MADTVVREYKKVIEGPKVKNYVWQGDGLVSEHRVIFTVTYKEYWGYAHLEWSAKGQVIRCHTTSARVSVTDGTNFSRVISDSAVIPIPSGYPNKKPLGSAWDISQPGPVTQSCNITFGDYPQTVRVAGDFYVNEEYSSASYEFNVPAKRKVKPNAPSMNGTLKVDKNSMTVKDSVKLSWEPAELDTNDSLAYYIVKISGEEDEVHVNNTYYTYSGLQDASARTIQFTVSALGTAGGKSSNWLQKTINIDLAPPDLSASRRGSSYTYDVSITNPNGVGSINSVDYWDDDHFISNSSSTVINYSDDQTLTFSITDGTGNQKRRATDSIRLDKFHRPPTDKQLIRSANIDKTKKATYYTATKSSTYITNIQITYDIDSNIGSNRFQSYLHFYSDANRTNEITDPVSIADTNVSSDITVNYDILKSMPRPGVYWKITASYGTTKNVVPPEDKNNQYVPNFYIDRFINNYSDTCLNTVEMEKHNTPEKINLIEFNDKLRMYYYDNSGFTINVARLHDVSTSGGAYRLIKTNTGVDSKNSKIKYIDYEFYDSKPIGSKQYYIELGINSDSYNFSDKTKIIQKFKDYQIDISSLNSLPVVFNYYEEITTPVITLHWTPQLIFRTDTPELKLSETDIQSFQLYLVNNDTEKLLSSKLTLRNADTSDVQLLYYKDGYDKANVLNLNMNGENLVDLKIKIKTSLNETKEFLIKDAIKLNFYKPTDFKIDSVKVLDISNSPFNFSYDNNFLQTGLRVQVIGKYESFNAETIVPKINLLFYNNKNNLAMEVLSVENQTATTTSMVNPVYSFDIDGNPIKLEPNSTIQKYILTIPKLKAYDFSKLQFLYTKIMNGRTYDVFNTTSNYFINGYNNIPNVICQSVKQMDPNMIITDYTFTNMGSYNESLNILQSINLKPKLRGVLIFNDKIIDETAIAKELTSLEFNQKYSQQLLEENISINGKPLNTLEWEFIYQGFKIESKLAQSFTNDQKQVYTYTDTNVGYTNSFPVYNYLPTVAYRRSAVGINTNTVLADSILTVNTAANRDKIVLKSPSGVNSTITLVGNATKDKTWSISNFIIDGGSWD